VLIIHTVTQQWILFQIVPIGANEIIVDESIVTFCYKISNINIFIKLLTLKKSRHSVFVV